MADRPRVFISYRREDTSGYAGRLYDALVASFGVDHVFMDIDTIEPGGDFTEVVERHVRDCDALIALIGRTWATATDGGGVRRLDKPEDWVRLELERGLQRAETRVIPALVQGAQMPSSETLPEGLRPLAFRHAIQLSDERWHYDVGRLIATLEKIPAQKREPPPAEPAPAPAPRPTPIIPRAGVADVVAAIAAVVLLVAMRSTWFHNVTTESDSISEATAWQALTMLRYALIATAVLAIGVLAVKLVRRGRLPPPWVLTAITCATGLWLAWRLLVDHPGSDDVAGATKPAAVGLAAMFVLCVCSLWTLYASRR